MCFSSACSQRRTDQGEIRIRRVPTAASKAVNFDSLSSFLGEELQRAAQQSHKATVRGHQQSSKLCRNRWSPNQGKKKRKKERWIPSHRLGARLLLSPRLLNLQPNARNSFLLCPCFRLIFWLWLINKSQKNIPDAENTKTENIVSSLNYYPVHRLDCT